MATPIYHITHIDNLPGIISQGGLWCDAERIKRGLRTVDIARAGLKQRRQSRWVSVAQRGQLGDYVPFYFANRSPMLYSIHTGYVAGYEGGQSSVVYLCSSVECLRRSGVAWCFTDGHAVEAFTGFYDAVADLDKVDWDVIGSWSWGNREDDLDRKRRKQAECLVHSFFPWTMVEGIAVISRAMVGRVNGQLPGTGHQPPVTVEREWYYD